jgi:choline dehydrogenase-like flavoprotein
MWGERLVEAAKQYRHWNGILVLANDENNGRVVVGEDGSESFEAHFDEIEKERMENALDFGRRVMEAAGAKQVAWTGPASTHVQGTCRMGSDPARSVVDSNCESHDAKRLFVGDASLFAKTLSVNPSMTIMALADRLAQHLDEDPNNYLSPRAAAVAA